MDMRGAVFGGGYLTLKMKGQGSLQRDMGCAVGCSTSQNVAKKVCVCPIVLPSNVDPTSNKQTCLKQLVRVCASLTLDYQVI